ncbi:MAG: hypothetical protein LBB15_01320 [Puniceicoccales bacterium]|nr:hypothetical protein [Puniceicoccales bacterium]
MSRISRREGVHVSLSKKEKVKVSRFSTPHPNVSNIQKYPNKNSSDINLTGRRATTPNFGSTFKKSSITPGQPSREGQQIKFAPTKKGDDRKKSSLSLLNSAVPAQSGTRLNPAVTAQSGTHLNLAVTAQKRTRGKIAGASSSFSTQKTQGESTTSNVQVPKAEPPDPKIAEISLKITDFAKRAKDVEPWKPEAIVPMISSLESLLVEIADVKDFAARNILTRAISPSAFDIAYSCSTLSLIEEFLKILAQVDTDTRPILLREGEQTYGGSLAKVLISNIENCLSPNNGSSLTNWMSQFYVQEPESNANDGIKLFDKVFDVVENLPCGEGFEILKGILAQCRVGDMSESTQNMFLDKVESFQSSSPERMKLVIAIATESSMGPKGWSYESTRKRLFQLISALPGPEKMKACRQLGCSVVNQCDAANESLFLLLKNMPANDVGAVLHAMVEHDGLSSDTNRPFRQKMLDAIYELSNDQFWQLSYRFKDDDFENFDPASMQKFALKLGLTCDDAEWNARKFQKNVEEKRNVEAPISKYLRVFDQGTDGAKLVGEKKECLMGAIAGGDWRRAKKLLCEVPALQALYNGDAQVQEGYSVGDHTEKVLAQFEDQEKFFNLSAIEGVIRRASGFENFKAKEFMMVMLLLHDIGKSIGQNALEQHIFTVPIMAAIMRNLGFLKNEIKLAELIVGNDILGEFQKNCDEDQSKQAYRVAGKLRELAHAAGIPSEAFFNLEYAFYICDASAYPSLLSNNMQKDQAGRLAFKSNSEKISNASAVKSCFEKAKTKDVGGFVGEVLKRKNFDPRMLFDASEANLENSVFDVASYISNNKNLVEKSGISAENKKTIFEMVDFAGVLQKDNFKESYAEDLILSRLDLRKQGNLYDKLTNTDGFGEHNNAKAQKCMNSFEKYCKEKIGNNFFASDFFAGFFQSSGDKILGFNLLVASARYYPLGEYFWVGPSKNLDPDPTVTSQRQLDDLLGRYGISQDQAMRAVAAWHALSIELMTKVDLPGKTEDNSIHLLRAEVGEVLLGYGISTNSSADVTKQMLRPPLGYACVGSCATAFGYAMCLMKIPMHLVFDGLHMPLKHTTANTVMYFPHGQPFEYVGDYDGELPTLSSEKSTAGVGNAATNDVLSSVFNFYRTTNENGQFVCGHLTSQ